MAQPPGCCEVPISIATTIGLSLSLAASGPAEDRAHFLLAEDELLLPDAFLADSHARHKFERAQALHHYGSKTALYSLGAAAVGTGLFILGDNTGSEPVFVTGGALTLGGLLGVGVGVPVAAYSSTVAIQSLRQHGTPVARLNGYFIGGSALLVGAAFVPGVPPPLAGRGGSLLGASLLIQVFRGRTVFQAWDSQKHRSRAELVPVLDPQRPGAAVVVTF